MTSIPFKRFIHCIILNFSLLFEIQFLNLTNENNVFLPQEFSVSVK